SPDPTALAARWGRILDRPVVTGPSGASEIALDNAMLRFVEVADGRGEGLGGVDLKVSDRAAILAAAAARGLQATGDAIVVCGTRFRLG
ncbi:MAG: hypothetical protein ISR50_14400, partial [Alphaproteobacteria bacterium]|nr:hypothetical protein [Alphaproteobacteria bacterium]